MHKNKGFTLVELLVVVVIMGVLSTVAGLSVSTVNATSAKRASSQINAYISTVRTKCMSRAGNPYAVIYVENGVVKGDYIEYGDDPTKKTVVTTVVTDKRVTVNYTAGANNNSAIPEKSSGGVSLKFARSTGKLLQPVDSGKLVFSITGGGKAYTVNVLAATGNHEIEG